MPFTLRIVSKRSNMDQTVLPANYTMPAFPSVNQMAPPLTEVADIQLQLLLTCRPPRDERLSWPGWMIDSRRLTHINGHPSTTGRAQDRESSPAKDGRSTAVPRNQSNVRQHTCNVDLVSVDTGDGCVHR